MPRMSVEVSRRSFLRGLSRWGVSVIRPPWSVGEAAFTASCTRCGECIRACPVRILVAGAGAFPQVDFTAAGCTFCGACADACEPRALDRDGAGRPWRLRVTVSAACLGARSVECRTCGDWCDSRALSFTLAGRPAPPTIDPERCTCCGACVAPCPVAAITVVPQAAAHQETHVHV